MGPSRYAALILNVRAHFFGAHMYVVWRSVSIAKAAARVVDFLVWGLVFNDEKSVNSFDGVAI